MNNLSALNSTTGNGTLNNRSPVFTWPFSKMEWIFGILFTHILFAMFIIISNSVVLYAFYKNSRLRTTTNIVIMSMAFADLLVGLFAIPVWLYNMHRIYNQGPPFTKTLLRLFVSHAFIDQSLALTSVYNLVYLHSLRCYSIVFPLRHRKMSKKPVILSMTLIWLFSTAFPPVTREVIVPKECENCFVIITLVVNIGIPLIIVSVANFILWKRVVKSSRQHQKKDTKIIVTIGILIGLLVVCYVPYMVAGVIHKWYKPVTLKTIIFLKFLHFSNSAFNPVVYALRNRDLGNTLKKLLCREQARDVTSTVQTMASSNPSHMAAVTTT